MNAADLLMIIHHSRQSVLVQQACVEASSLNFRGARPTDMVVGAKCGSDCVFTGSGKKGRMREESIEDEGILYSV